MRGVEGAFTIRYASIVPDMKGIKHKMVMYDVVMALTPLGPPSPPISSPNGGLR